MQWKLRKADAMEAKEYLPEAVETLLYWSNARERGCGELPVARGPYSQFRGVNSILLFLFNTEGES